MNFTDMLIKYFEEFPNLETERLNLLPLDLKHSNAVFDMFSNSEVVKYYDLPLMSDITQAENFLKNHIRNFNNKREIRWGLILKQNQQLIGTCGIAPAEFEFTQDCNNIGLGFDLNRHYWRKGLMKEAIKKIIVFCFENLTIEKMHLENLRENINCTKLADSLFFKILKTTHNVQIMPNQFASIDYYELARDTFEKYQNEFNR